MARFRRRLGSGRCVGFATARTWRQVPRRHAGKPFRVRWQRRFYACDRERWKTGNSSSRTVRTPHLSASFIFGISMHANGADMATNLDALLHLTQALESAQPGGEAAPGLGNAERSAGRQRSATDGGGASAEHRIDARHFERTFQPLLARDRSSPEPSSADAASLWSELSRKDGNARSPCEVKLAMFGDSIAVACPREQWLDPILPLRLESRERGRLDTLRFAPFELPPCGPGQVLIEVKAAGMNFRDVLKALALYPGDAPDARIFGDEVGGIVKAVGSDVTHVAPGDRVFGLAVFGIATHAIARAGDVRRIPAGLTFRGGGDVTGRFHDRVACAAKRGAIARGRARPRSRGRGWSRNGCDPDRAASRRGSDRHAPAARANVLCSKRSEWNT